MGILGSAYRFLDPVLPFDRQLDPRFGNGILSSANYSGGQTAQAVPAPQGSPVEPVMGFPGMSAPQQPQAAPAAPQQPRKLSLTDMLWGMTLGTTPTLMRQAQETGDARRMAAQTAQMQRADMIRQMRSVITDPREWAVFIQNPEEWSKRNAERYGVQNIGQGNTAMYGDPSAGGSAYTAPEMGVDGGQFYTQTPAGASVTGHRDPSFAEQTGRINATNPIAASDGTVLIDPVTRQPVYQNSKEFAPRAPGRGPAHANPGGNSAALGAIEAELKRRGLIK